MRDNRNPLDSINESDGIKKKIVSVLHRFSATGLVVLFLFGAALLSFSSCKNAFESALGTSLDGNGNAELSDDYNRLLELYTLISQNYMGEMDHDTMMQTALQAYVASLGDPYSSYMTKSQQEAFIDGDYGNKVGIGIRIYMLEDSCGLNVYYVFANSSAEVAGLKKGDVITAVDGVAVTYENYTESVNRVAGEEGTTVNLTVLRGDESFELSVTRCSFVVKSVEYRMLEGSEDIGYVRIDSLASDTVAAFKEAVEALKELGAAKYIFDVRDDSGGYLSTITEILDLLLPEGPIVHYNSSDGSSYTEYSDAATILNAPMAVLINGNTASAAELFAAALQDYKLATLVGETTYGKGVMQTLYTLSNGDTLKLTTSEYSPPYSENYNGVGVKPDVEVSLPEGKIYYMYSDEDDPQIQAAVEALESLGMQD